MPGHHRLVIGPDHYRSMKARSVGDELVGSAALVALGVFVFSGGVYAGADGPVRGAALVVGVVAVALAVVLLLAYARMVDGARDRGHR
jgi:hypothetical protein